MGISRRQEWILRLTLAVGGALFACAIGTVAYYILKNRAASAGQEFASIKDLRASLATADNRNQAQGRITLGSIIQPHPDDQLIYDLRPNLSVNFQGAAVHTNSCGQREREISRSKPAGVYRIAIVGDSFTFGWGVKEDEAFPRQLEQILNSVMARNLIAVNSSKHDLSENKYHSVEVLNFGVPGYSPFQEVATFEQNALDYDPDAVILFFIENDFGMPFFIRDVEQPQKLFATANLSKLAHTIVAGSDNTPVSQPKLPVEFDPNRALQKLARIADNHGVRVFLAINPKKNWRPIHQKLWVLKKTHQIKFMNFYNEFERMIHQRGYSKESLTLKKDQHPSPRKHQMLAEVMAPYFLDAVLQSKTYPAQKGNINNGALTK